MNFDKTKFPWRLTLGAATAVTLFLAGCGSDSGQADTVSERATTTAVAATSTDNEQTAGTQPTDSAESSSDETTVPETVPEDTSPPDPEAGSKDPESIIVRLEDLPTGWSPTPDEDDEEDDESTSCLDTLFPDDLSGFFEDPNAPTAEAAFQQSEFGPFLGAGVTTEFPDGERLFDGLGDRFAACDGTTDSDGVTYSIMPVSFPNLGDDTFAVRVDGENPEGFPVSFVMALVRVDDVMIMTFGAAVMGPADAQLVEDVTRTMVDRT